MSEMLQCLKLNRPDFFERDDFAGWLINTPCVATWHHKGLTQPVGSCSDVFTVYDHGDGPDACEIPPEVWGQIDAECKNAGMTYGVVWLTNCAE